MAISQVDIESLISFRQFLHAHPSLSNHEQETARIIKEKLLTFTPDLLVENVGGHGIFAVLDSKKSGPTIVFRCELDALPIQEINTFSYQSTREGIAHKCGHDGHMTILCGLAQILAKQRPSSGKVVLLFQPAEETGDGARQVMMDERLGVSDEE